MLKLARPKIAVVRDFIGAVNDNFLHGLGREALLQKMDEIASDVKGAAKKLAELTGVENTVVEDGDAPSYLAGGLIALSHVNDENAEVFLSQKFMEYASDPYFKLRALEEGEKACGHVCPAKATEAMVGLASLHVAGKGRARGNETIVRAVDERSGRIKEDDHGKCERNDL